MSDAPLSGAPIAGRSSFKATLTRAPAWVPLSLFGTPRFNPSNVSWWTPETVAVSSRFGVPVVFHGNNLIWCQPKEIGLTTRFGEVRDGRVAPNAIGLTSHYGSFAVRKSGYTQLPEFQRVFNERLRTAAITQEVAWPNIVYRPKKGVAYLKPESAGRMRSPLGFGADSVQQWQGVYQVGVFVPRDTGELEQERLASRVMAAFPRGMTLRTSQAIDVKISHSTAPAPVPFGDWSNLPVQVYWFAVEPPPPL